MLSMLQGNSETREPNRTGLPDAMKARFERLSGLSLDDVRVHRNSDKPSEMGALAYAQGNEIYIGPRYEKHLEHELGHVVQQKYGLVKPTGKISDKAINDDEKMEAQASAFSQIENLSTDTVSIGHSNNTDCIQGVFIPEWVIECFFAFFKEFKEPRPGKSSNPSFWFKNVVNKSLFQAENLKFASKSDGNFGSIYFSNDSGDGGRIRLTHPDGPQISKQKNIKRFVLSEEELENYEGKNNNRKRKKTDNRKTSKKKKIGIPLDTTMQGEAKNFFEESLKKIDDFGGTEIVEDTLDDKRINEKTILEIWPDEKDSKKIGEHVSRGYPAKLLNLEQDDVDFLRLAVEFSQNRLPELMPYADRINWTGKIIKDNEKRYLADLKNDFLRVVMQRRGNLRNIPMDSKRYYDEPRRRKQIR